MPICFLQSGSSTSSISDISPVMHMSPEKTRGTGTGVGKQSIDRNERKDGIMNTRGRKSARKCTKLKQEPSQTKDDGHVEPYLAISSVLGEGMKVTREPLLSTIDEDERLGSGGRNGINRKRMKGDDIQVKTEISKPRGKQMSDEQGTKTRATRTTVGKEALEIVEKSETSRTCTRKTIVIDDKEKTKVAEENLQKDELDGYNTKKGTLRGATKLRSRKESAVKDEGWETEISRSGTQEETICEKKEIVPSKRISLRMKIKEEQDEISHDNQTTSKETERTESDHVPTLRISRRLKTEQKEDDSQPFEFEVKVDESKHKAESVKEDNIIENLNKKEHGSQPGTRRSSRRNAGLISEKDAATFEFTRKKGHTKGNNNSGGKPDTADNTESTEDSKKTLRRQIASLTKVNEESENKAVYTRISARNKRISMEIAHRPATTGSDTDSQVFQTETKSGSKRRRKTDNKLVQEMNSQEPTEPKRGRGKRRYTIQDVGNTSEKASKQATTQNDVELLEPTILINDDDPEFLDLINSAKRPETKPAELKNVKGPGRGRRKKESDATCIDDGNKPGAGNRKDEEKNEHIAVTSRLKKSDEKVKRDMRKPNKPDTQKDSKSGKTNGRYSRSSRTETTTTLAEKAEQKGGEILPVPTRSSKSNKITGVEPLVEDAATDVQSQSKRSIRGRKNNANSNVISETVVKHHSDMNKEEPRKKKSAKCSPEPNPSKETSIRGKKRSLDNTDSSQVIIIAYTLYMVDHTRGVSDVSSIIYVPLIFCSLSHSNQQTLFDNKMFHHKNIFNIIFYIKMMILNYMF